MANGDRGQGIHLPPSQIGLPPRPFLYTIDQIAAILYLKEETVKKSYLYLEGRSIGQRHRYLMVARNIAPPDSPPDWRVVDRELIRWMKFKGYRYYDRGAVGS